MSNNNNNNGNDCPGPSKSNSKSNKSIGKTQVLVLSPDILKKLGIANQLTNLTKLQKQEDPVKTAIVSKNSLETQIRQNLKNIQQKSTLPSSKLHHNAARDKNADSNSIEIINNRNQLASRSSETISANNNSNSTENKRELKTTNNDNNNLISNNNNNDNERQKSIKQIIKNRIQTKINTQNHVSSGATDDKQNSSNNKNDSVAIDIPEKLSPSAEQNNEKLAKSRVQQKNIKQQIEEKCAGENDEITITPKTKKTRRKSVLQETSKNDESLEDSPSVRKSGRKRKVSSILENYVTVFSGDITSTTQQLHPENSEKSAKSNPLKNTLSTEKESLEPTELESVNDVGTKKKNILSDDNVETEVEKDDFVPFVLKPQNNVVRTFSRKAKALINKAEERKVSSSDNLTLCSSSSPDNKPIPITVSVTIISKPISDNPEPILTIPEQGPLVTESASVNSKPASIVKTESLPKNTFSPSKECPSVSVESTSKSPLSLPVAKSSCSPICDSSLPSPPKNTVPSKDGPSESDSSSKASVSKSSSNPVPVSSRRTSRKSIDSSKEFPVVSESTSVPLKSSPKNTVPSKECLAVSESTDYLVSSDLEKSTSKECPNISESTAKSSLCIPVSVISKSNASISEVSSEKSPALVVHDSFEEIITQRPSVIVQDSKNQSKTSVSEEVQKQKPVKPVINIIENKVVKNPIIFTVMDKKKSALNEPTIADIPIVFIDENKTNNNRSIDVNTPEENNTGSNAELCSEETSVKSELINTLAHQTAPSEMDESKDKINDPRVTAIIGSKKRGRPKGRKNREVTPFVFTYAEIEKPPQPVAAEDLQDKQVANVKVETVPEEVSEEKVPAARLKARRKRVKSISFVDAVEEDCKKEQEEEEEETKATTAADNEEIGFHSKRKRRKINIIDSDNDEEIEEKETSEREEEIKPVKRRCGRPRKNKVQVDVELVKKEEEDDDDDNEEEVDGKGKPGKRKQSTMPLATSTPEKFRPTKIVECGVCHQSIANVLWNSHAATHNFLCWRVGEQEIDLNDRKLVESILVKIALKKKISFTCAKCGEKRKSAVGYLSHVDMCQKSTEERMAMRVECPECGRLMQPCSLKSHLRLSHGNKSTIDEKLIIATDENSSGGRLKRSAAKKAQNLINMVSSQESDQPTIVKGVKRYYKKGFDGKKFFSLKEFNVKIEKLFKRNDSSLKCSIKDCNFVGNTLDKIKEHIENCPKITADDFICMACFYTTQDEREVQKHVRTEHMKDKDDNKEFKSKLDDGDEVGGNDDDDEEEEEEEDDEDEDDAEDDEDVKDLANEFSGGRGVKDGTENKKKRKKTLFSELRSNSTVSKINFLAREMRIKTSFPCAYAPAGKWTLDFCEKNYCLKNLFPHFRCPMANWFPVAVDDYDKYLPPVKQSMSVRTCYVTKRMPNVQADEHVWKTYDLFESEVENDTVTIFCGGSIWAMAWVPTPYDTNTEQILAVSVYKDYQMKFKVSQSYASSEIVQFWNFGSLAFDKVNQTAPKLEFCLAHNHGNVWCMEWCPSGCYDDDNDDNKSLKRMGLLAMACSDGSIPVYSVCFPDQLPKNESESDEVRIFKPKESCKLIVNDVAEDVDKLGGWNYQCTKLYWMKAKGHSVIVAGYTNGLVCFWDLSTTSPLLYSKTPDDIVILRPYKSFQPHTAAITALYLYPLSNGRKWCITGSADRNSYFWDLDDLSAPMFVFSRRSSVTDGAVLMNWICAVIAYDDVFLFEHTVTLVQNPREFGYKGRAIMAANSVVTSLSANDWGNAFAQTTLAGELVCTFPRQLLISCDVEKTSKCKRMLISYCEPVEKNLDAKSRVAKQELKMKNQKNNTFVPDKNDKSFIQYLNKKDNEPFEEEPLTFEEAQKKYGLVFCDINMEDHKLIPDESLQIVKQSLRMRNLHPELYPFMALNRVVWNPNKQAYLHVATGSQVGFLRLRSVRFMHTRVSQIK